MRKNLAAILVGILVAFAISAGAQISSGGGIFGFQTTGTGPIIVRQTNPTLITPVLGVATGTSLTLSSAGALPLTLNAVANDANIVFQESGNIKWYVRNLASDAGFSIYDNVNATQRLLLNTTGATIVGQVLSGRLRQNGAVPTMGACGTSPTIVGGDSAMTVTVGTGGVATACAVTFSGSAWSVTPSCTAQSDTDIVAFKVVETTTTVTITAVAPFTASSKLKIHCTGVA